MIGLSAHHWHKLFRYRGAVIAATVLVLCFTTARLAEAPMAADTAPMAAMESTVGNVADGASQARIVVEMGVMLCLDDGVGTQAGGVPQPMSTVTWSVVVVTLFAVIWLGRGQPSQHARSPGPVRQALLQRFQL